MAITTKLTTSEKILKVLDRKTARKGLTSNQVASQARVPLKTVRNLLPIMARRGLIDYS